MRPLQRLAIAIMRLDARLEDAEVSVKLTPPSHPTVDAGDYDRIIDELAALRPQIEAVPFDDPLDADVMHRAVKLARRVRAELPPGDPLREHVSAFMHANDLPRP